MPFTTRRDHNRIHPRSNITKIHGPLQTRCEAVRVDPFADGIEHVHNGRSIQLIARDGEGT